jgi:hypothetical protein
MKKPPTRIEGDIGYVPLACGAEAIIDAEDAELVGQHNWRLDGDGYAVAWSPRVNGKRRMLKLHRLVMGEPEGKQVDHRKGAKLDNRKDLLRVATPAQNNKNSKMRANNTSGHKGVCWDQRAKKWKASISHEGKTINLGRFTILEAAAQAYREAALKYHKEFANFG